MKNNRNNLTAADYYLGLDIGTNSVGWAVCDTEYRIPRFKGNAMWGVRLFEEAMGAQDRRTNRTARRRLKRKHQRLMLLELLFANAVNEKDPQFFTRLRESALHEEDRSLGVHYTLFNDRDFTDRDYFRRYPTIYHLRSELARSDAPHDVRLVFLALHHIVKSRGHFLYELGEGDSDVSLDAQLAALCAFIAENFEKGFCEDCIKEYAALMCDGELGITEKKKRLTALAGEAPEEHDELNTKAVSALLAGAKVNLSELFCDPALKNAEPAGLRLKDDMEESLSKLESVLNDRQLELLLLLKDCFDNARLALIRGEHKYICDAKVAQFEQNKRELAALKAYVRKAYATKYRRIFSQKADKLDNYAAYSRYKLSSGDYVCDQEKFCAFLKKELPLMAADESMAEIWKKINEKSFLPRLKGSDNGVIPYQLHKSELLAILENASKYLSFLNETDPDGHSVKDKIVSVFEFRIPYYVGPLNPKSPNAWIVRTGEKIYPWNFSETVDLEKSAEGFLINLIGRCTYTGQPTIPADSLLYSRYCVLNEINNLKLNGESIPVEVKQRIYRELFEGSPKALTKKGIFAYLLSEGLAAKGDELSGVDDRIKSRLKSYHDMKFLLERGFSEERVEEIIRRVVVFGEDKKMLRRWLERSCPELDGQEISRISRLKYKDWGRLSAEFLTGLYTPGELGEAKTVMDMLWESNNNLMQLMSGNFSFAQQAEEVRQGEGSIQQQLEEMYIAPAVRRSVWQALKIVDEIVDIRRAAPKKIFIEVARGDRNAVKAQRTESRKNKLIELYKACGEDSGEIFERLCGEDEGALRQDKLFLYYTQMGRCMYSGEPIELENLAGSQTYDIDHIYPRSRIKDDSLDNRVLVKSSLNRSKTNIYPIDARTREERKGFWAMLKAKGLISQKKYERLVRCTGLTDEELASFVARQLVETQQSTKAVATIMKKLYPESRIVYSKAGNVSDFRQQFGLTKSREINDLHHAKDAYLNIVVGNVYDTKFTTRFFANIRSENYSLNRVFDYDTKGAWSKDSSIATVKKYYGKNNILVTRRPYEVKGQLFDLQLMAAGKGQLEKKAGLDIAKYGGYNKISGAYFCVVEHQDKKKRVRSIEPVYIYKKALYEREPLRYCTEVLGLKDPVIILPRLLSDAMMELDGSRLLICGRTGNRNVYKHTYQLSVGQEQESYIKAVSKYAERCFKARTELPVTSYDKVNFKDNMALYDYFCEKLRIPQYAPLFANVLKDMKDNRAVFEAINLLEQCKLLLEILKAFKCDRQCPDFSVLCGKGTVGILMKSKVLSSLGSAYLVNQSITGLFETRTDLLAAR